MSMQDKCKLSSSCMKVVVPRIAFELKFKSIRAATSSAANKT